MENHNYQEHSNNENENISPSMMPKQNSLSKKEHFRSRMKTQLTISNGVSLKQKLRTQQTIDFSVMKPTVVQDEFYYQYEELEKIGEGSHSIVKKCLNKMNKKIYAVKIIRTDDTEIINQAKTEYQIVKDLNHENILKVHEMFINEKSGYVRLITEYTESITLKKFIERNANKYLTEQQSAKITTQILSALSYLHRNQVVHRDIKPSNILIQPENQKVTLIDFGISRFFCESQEIYTPTGTPLYKAPEMIKGDSYNQSADSWSLGITLFEMLTGTKPFNYTYRENEMIIKMENQVFVNNQKYKCLSQNAQEFIKLLLNPDSNQRLDPKEGLKHSFITRCQNENSILCSQDLNKPVILNTGQLTPPKKICLQENHNQVSSCQSFSSSSKATKRLTYSCGKNTNSFSEYLNTLSKEYTPLKNNTNIMNNYSPQMFQLPFTKQSSFTRSSHSELAVLREIEN